MIPETIECVQCGATLAVDSDHANWSVRTEKINGAEMVVERHLSIVCDQCGVTEVRYNPDPAAVDGGEFPARLFNLVVVPVDPPEPL